MPEQFVTVNVGDILVGEELPFTIYIYIDFRFITFRAEGDVIDRLTYDRLEFKKVQNLFVREVDRKLFEAWTQPRQQEKAPPLTPETLAFATAREDVHRKTMDIFQSAH